MEASYPDFSLFTEEDFIEKMVAYVNTLDMEACMAHFLFLDKDLESRRDNKVENSIHLIRANLRDRALHLLLQKIKNRPAG